MRRTSRPWVQVAASLTLAAICIVLWAATASAKFPRFELRVTATHVEAGEAIEIEAIVDGQSGVDFAAAPRLVPPVSLYRTGDLPVRGEGPGDAVPIAEVSFTPERDGVFRARLTVDEPGSYQLVSIGVWNYELAGYPEPVELSVVATSLDQAESDLPWPVLGTSLAALVTAALVGTALARRRAPTI